MNEYRETIIEGISERHPDCSVTVECVKGNNGTSYEGFLIKLCDTQCFPVIPCEGLERALMEEECDLEGVLDRVDEILNKRVELDASFFADYVKVRDKIYIRVINKKQNKELLEHAPHREYLDLAVTYRIGPIHTGNMEGSTLITDSMFQEWGITKNELFEVAYENSFKTMPEIVPMTTLMRQMMSKEDVELDIELALEMKDKGKEYMYVCGHGTIAGAACILNNELLQRFSEEVDEDFLILPSSIYELLFLPMRDEYKVERFVQMVEEVNCNVVSENEILSFHIYKYDRQKDAVIDLCA